MRRARISERPKAGSKRERIWINHDRHVMRKKVKIMRRLTVENVRQSFMSVSYVGTSLDTLILTPHWSHLNKHTN